MRHLTRDFVKATTVALDDLTAGGKLPDDRWSEFVQKVREKATMRDYATIAPITESGKLLIPNMETQDQIIHKQQGLKNPADYAMTWMTFGEQQVNTFNFETIIFLEDDWMKGNVQEQAGVDAAISLLASRFAANMEEINLYSNTLGPAIKESELVKTGSSSQYIKFEARSDSNGWLETMENGATVVDAEDSNDLDALFGEALMEFPERYDEYLDDARFFVPTRLKKIHQINLAKSATNLGDLARNGQVPMMPYGQNIQAVPLLKTRPWEVEHVTLTGTTAVNLEYKPVLASELVVLPSTLGSTAVTPYVEDTDYNFTEATAALAREASGSNITSGQTVKAYYKTGTKAFLTFPGNLVFGMTRDISITPWRYEPGAGTYYIIRGKMGQGMLLPDAAVLIKNIKATPKSA